jgi:hypothetical protein
VVIPVSPPLPRPLIDDANYDIVEPVKPGEVLEVAEVAEVAEVVAEVVEVVEVVEATEEIVDEGADEQVPADDSVSGGDVELSSEDGDVGVEVDG